MKSLPQPRALFHQLSLLLRWLWAAERRWTLFLAASLVALGTFMEISEELLEDDELSIMDERILRFVASYRVAWLTITFVDITALGSRTVLGLATLGAAVALVRLADVRGALQMLFATAGAGFWTLVTKQAFGRARPELVERLIEVQGYSFPSGHSAGAATVYLAFAMVFTPHLRTLTSRGLLIVAACSLAVLVGFSRVYLGVHYPSDVVSGLVFGSGWVLLLSAPFEWRRGRARAASGARSLTR